MAVTAKRPGKAAILRAAVEVMGEDGYEGASIRDMATRPACRWPRSTTTSRRSTTCCASSSTRRSTCRWPASSGAWPGTTSPVEQLEEIVGTIIWSNLHDDFARRAASVVSSEYTRLRPPERAAIEVKRKALLDLVEKVVRDGVASGGSRPMSHAKRRARS